MRVKGLLDKGMRRIEIKEDRDKGRDMSPSGIVAESNFN